MTGQRSTLSKLTPLSASSVKFLDTLLNLTAEVPDLTLKMSILSSATWRTISNETLSVIRRTGEIWVHNIIEKIELKDKYNTTRSYVPFTRLNAMFHILDSSVDLLAGGDVWQKLRVIYENSKMKHLLTLIEDLPNIVVSVVDTFVKTDRLDDFVEKLSLGKAHPCDVDKYLTVPSFVRKKGLLSSIANYCQKLVYGDSNLEVMDVLPTDAKYKVR